MELPDRGQPLDISFLLRMVSEINRLTEVISTTGTQSSLKYLGQNQTTLVPTSDILFFAGSQQVSGNTSTADSSPTTRFDFSFRSNPIVIASVQSVSGSDNVYCVVKNVSTTSCEVKLVIPSGTTGQVSANISIIAIGERV